MSRLPPGPAYLAAAAALLTGEGSQADDDPALHETMTGATGSPAGGRPEKKLPLDVRLCLFGGPYVERAGARLPVPDGAQRLVALVALRDGWADRRVVAGLLWPDVPEERAAGNLRSAIWRLKSAGLDVLAVQRWALVLQDCVVVDALEVSAWADRLVRGRQRPEDLALDRLAAEPDELLPGWVDDWVTFERERLRQRVLHALETLSAELGRVGRHGEAVEAALSAVRMEPLRESAQRTLVRAHLAEGNRAEAIRTVDAYARLLQRELGIGVSGELSRLVRPS